MEFFRLKEWARIFVLWSLILRGTILRGLKSPHHTPGLMAEDHDNVPVTVHDADEEDQVDDLA